MSKSDRVAEGGAWVLEHGHRLLLALTGGRYPRTVMGMLPVELHTVGRKSGKAYANLLTSPVHDDGRIVVVASKGGHQHDPDWYKNAVANPDVMVAVGAGDAATVPMRARTATAEERAELWPEVVKAYKGYAAYQKNTDREIPLLVLEPRPAG